MSGACVSACVPLTSCPAGSCGTISNQCGGTLNCGACSYQLTTLTTGDGMVTGAGSYTAGTNVTVTATPDPGSLFTGFSGALTGTTNPQTLVTTAAAETVTANFVEIPQATLSAVVSSKSGTSNSRVWTITVTNGGPGIAYFAQLAGLMLTQTFGTACKPVGTSPLAFPISLGNMAAGSSVPVQVTLDFSSCPSGARFTAGIVFTANDGWTAGQTQLTNQFE